MPGAAAPPPGAQSLTPPVKEKSERRRSLAVQKSAHPTASVEEVARLLREAAKLEEEAAAIRESAEATRQRIYDAVALIEDYESGKVSFQKEEKPKLKAKAKASTSRISKPTPKKSAAPTPLELPHIGEPRPQMAVAEVDHCLDVAARKEAEAEMLKRRAAALKRQLQEAIAQIDTLQEFDRSNPRRSKLSMTMPQLPTLEGTTPEPYPTASRMAAIAAAPAAIEIATIPPARAPPKTQGDGGSSGHRVSFTGYPNSSDEEQDALEPDAAGSATSETWEPESGSRAFSFVGVEAGDATRAAGAVPRSAVPRGLNDFETTYHAELHGLSPSVAGPRVENKLLSRNNDVVGATEHAASHQPSTPVAGTPLAANGPTAPSDGRAVVASAAARRAPGANHVHATELAAWVAEQQAPSHLEGAEAEWRDTPLLPKSFSTGPVNVLAQPLNVGPPSQASTSSQHSTEESPRRSRDKRTSSRGGGLAALVTELHRQQSRTPSVASDAARRQSTSRVSVNVGHSARSFGNTWPEAGSSRSRPVTSCEIHTGEAEKMGGVKMFSASSSPRKQPLPLEGVDSSDLAARELAEIEKRIAAKGGEAAAKLQDALLRFDACLKKAPIDNRAPKLQTTLEAAPVPPAELLHVFSVIRVQCRWRGYRDRQRVANMYREVDARRRARQASEQKQLEEGANAMASGRPSLPTPLPPQAGGSASTSSTREPLFAPLECDAQPPLKLSAGGIMNRTSVTSSDVSIRGVSTRDVVGAQPDGHVVSSFRAASTIDGGGAPCEDHARNGEAQRLSVKLREPSLTTSETSLDANCASNAGGAPQKDQVVHPFQARAQKNSVRIQRPSLIESETSQRESPRACATDDVETLQETCTFEPFREWDWRPSASSPRKPSLIEWACSHGPRPACNDGGPSQRKPESNASASTKAAASRAPWRTSHTVEDGEETPRQNSDFCQTGLLAVSAATAVPSHDVYDPAFDFTKLSAATAVPSNGGHERAFDFVKLSQKAETLFSHLSMPHGSSAPSFDPLRPLHESASSLASATASTAVSAATQGAPTSDLNRSGWSHDSATPLSSTGCSAASDRAFAADFAHSLGLAVPSYGSHALASDPPSLLHNSKLFPTSLSIHSHKEVPRWSHRSAWSQHGSAKHSPRHSPRLLVHGSREASGVPPSHLGQWSRDRIWANGPSAQRIPSSRREQSPRDRQADGHGFESLAEGHGGLTPREDRSERPYLWLEEAALSVATDGSGAEPPWSTKSVTSGYIVSAPSAFASVAWALRR